MEAIGARYNDVQKHLCELTDAHTSELAADISCAQTFAHLNELSARICASNAADHLPDDVAQRLLELIQNRRIALKRDSVHDLPCPHPPLSSAHAGIKTVPSVRVRSRSWKKGKEGRYWRQINDQEAAMMMQAARRLESTRQQGQRSGPLGGSRIGGTATVSKHGQSLQGTSGAGTRLGFRKTETLQRCCCHSSSQLKPIRTTRQAAAI